MICHIGKNINSGHYKYFAKDRRVENQWIELSDKNVLKFSLDKSDEEFEREMQTDMAPYILFYRKVDWLNGGEMSWMIFDRILFVFMKFFE